MPNSLIPNSRQFSSSVRTCRSDVWSAMGSLRSPGVVGTLWSIVATVRPGRLTLLPFARSPSKACGDVTSCTMCLST